MKNRLVEKKQTNVSARANRGRIIALSITLVTLIAQAARENKEKGGEDENAHDFAINMKAYLHGVIHGDSEQVSHAIVGVADNLTSMNFPSDTGIAVALLQMYKTAQEITPIK